MSADAILFADHNIIITETLSKLESRTISMSHVSAVELKEHFMLKATQFIIALGGAYNVQ